MEEKVKKVLGWIKEYLSWVIAVGGLVVSIYGIKTSSQLSNRIVYLVVIIDSLILLGLGIYIITMFFKNSTFREEKEKLVFQQKEMIEKLEQKNEKEQKAFLALETNDNYIIRTLHKFLARLYNLTNEVFDETDKIEMEEYDMREHGYTKQEIEQKIVALAKEKNMKFSGMMYDDYKRFLSNILSKTQENIETYLKTKGYDIEVAVTLKQFIKPCLLNKDKRYLTEPYVYTAFRDSRTWAKKTRKEIGERLYTVEKNSDFIHCVTQGYYIFNNKSTKSKDYINENTEFDKYYNCGVTTLIVSTEENNDKFGYGFLACDILNKKHPNEEIMDQTVAQILDTTAFVIATYYDNIDYNWDLCQVNVQFRLFWDMLYSIYKKRVAI